MTLGELRAALAAIGPEHDGVKVWFYGEDQCANVLGSVEYMPAGVWAPGTVHHAARINLDPGSEEDEGD